MKGDQRSTRTLAFALALALAFGAWEIAFADFMADDLMQLGVLEGVSPAAAWTGIFDLYTISDGDGARVLAMKNAGLIPWFIDPAFEMAFLRPLSSALLASDHALFGLHPAGYRLHGVLWSLALILAAGAILRRALPDRTGTIALLVFVLSGIHGMFCWTAARHVVIAAALGFASLAAHLRWREDGWRPGAILSLVALVLSLAASEVGVAVAMYLLAYEAFGAFGAVRDRLRGATPALLVLGVYVLVWRLLGHGASLGTGYVDPLRDPRAFLFELPIRLAALTGGVVLGGGGTDLWVIRPDLRTAIGSGGALATLALVLLLRAAWPEISPDERRAVRWLGTAAVLSAVPFAGTPIGARCLLVPFLGGAGLVAVVMHRWWVTWRYQPGLRHRALGAACAGLAVIHLGVAPLARIGMPVLLQRGLADRAAAAARDAEWDAATGSGQTAVLLAAPDFVVGLHAPFYRLLHRLPMPAAWRLLSWAPGPHHFVRIDADTLEMDVAGGGIDVSTLRPGSVVTLRGMEATVLAAGDLGPTRVRFHFDRRLDDPSLRLLGWHDGRFRRIDPPPIGGTIVVHGG